MSRIFGALAIVVCVLTSPSTTQADLTNGSWYLDQSNSMADDVNYGRVDILADSSAGTVQFTVDAFMMSGAYSGFDNVGIDKFGFNFTDDVTGGWKVSLPDGSWSESYDQTLGNFGSFMAFESGASNHDPLSFTLTLGNADEAVASNFMALSDGADSVFFAAHVVGFGPDGTIPCHIIGGSTPVPAPGAAVLAMLGLGLLGWMKRRLA